MTYINVRGPRSNNNGRKKVIEPNAKDISN